MFYTRVTESNVLFEKLVPRKSQYLYNILRKIGEFIEVG
jgi:hypothetical protein